MDWQREVVDPTEFVEGLKLDVFQDQVFVFTPKGDVKDLPRDATPLDFAYRIHTDVGHRTIGAKVNNRLVPLDYRLRNGDIVEIVTTKAAHGPSRDWLNIVRTSHAREKIRAWFKRQQRDENIAQGRELLDRELRRLAHETLASVSAAKLTEIAAQYKMREIDDFYAAIGYGAISSASVVSKLEIHDDASIMLPEEAPPAAPSTTGVRVKGVGDLLVRFAKCCSPIPGDQITGYVTRGKGVTIHRSSCPSVLSERDIERLIDVEWELVAQNTYPITVRITRHRPAGAAQRGHERRGRVQGQHRGRLGRHARRRHRHDHRHLQGHLAPAAGAGAVEDRAAARRDLRHPRGAVGVPMKGDRVEAVVDTGQGGRRRSRSSRRRPVGGSR